MEFYRDFPNTSYIQWLFAISSQKKNLAQITTFNCIFQLVFIIRWNQENASISLAYSKL